MQQTLSDRRRFPLLGRFGGAVMLLGLVADTAAHSLTDQAHEAVIAGFPVSEHVAHLVVFVGMVLVLAAVVADGARDARRRALAEGSPSRAVR
jgi:hypothetical protein